VLVVLVNGAFFVNARPLARDFDTRSRRGAHGGARGVRLDLQPHAAALHEHEEVVRTYVDAIRGLYPPEETVVITELGNARSYPWLRHAMFYLPEYSIFELRVGELPPGYYAPQLASTSCRRPTATCGCPRARGGSCGSWITGRPRWRGRRTRRDRAAVRPLPLHAADRPAPIAYAGYTLVVTADRRDDLLVLLAARCRWRCCCCASG